jgi:O-antigen ligase
MNLINKISILHLTNLILSLIPLAFILGNPAININFIAFIILGSIYIIKNKINFKYNTTILILASLFLFIIFSSLFNLITKYEKDFIIIVPDALSYHEDLIKYLYKSFIFTRFFFFILIFFILASNNLLNLKYLLITISILTLILSFDVIFQNIFEYDIFGIKPSAPGDNSGFFGSELVAGGYLQRFSMPAIFFLTYYFHDKKYSSLILVTSIILIGTAIILSGNRMPLPLYFLSLLLFLTISKNFNKEIILGIIILIIIFSTLFKYNQETKVRYGSFYGATKRLYNYTAVQTNNIIIEKTNKNYILPLTPSSRTEQLDKIFYMKGSGHLELFRAAFYTFKENYLFGHGMKNFHNECRQIQIKYKIKGTPIDCNSHPHNFFFEVLTSLGIIGIIMYFIFITNIFYIYLKKSLGKFEKFNNLKFVIFNSSLISLLIEIFPIRSSGSIFSTSNSSYVFLFIALVIGTMYKKKL